MSSTLRIISEASVADRIICSLTCKKKTTASKSTRSKLPLRKHYWIITGFIPLRKLPLRKHGLYSLQSSSSRTHLPCSPGSIHRCLDLPCPQPFRAQHLHPSVCCLLHAPLSAVISTQLSLGLQPARPCDVETCWDVIQCQHGVPLELLTRLTRDSFKGGQMLHMFDPLAGCSFENQSTADPPPYACMPRGSGGQIAVYRTLR